MTSQRTNVLVGVLLLAAGVLILLLNFGVIGPLGDAVWSLLFIGGGIAFLAVYLKNREQWWPIIPGMVLIGLGGVVFFSNTGLEGDWVPALLFGAIAFAFLVIYLTQPAENWWALIPAGVLALIGIFLFADEMEIVEQLSNLWPLVLIVIGVVVLFGAFRSRRPAEDDDEVSQADR